MKELYKRSITGIVILGVTIGSVILGGYAFFAFCCVICLGALFEFYRLEAIPRTYSQLGIALGGTLLITVFLYSDLNINWRIVLVNLPLLSIIVFSAIYSKLESPFQHLVIVVFGQVYITLALILLYRIGFLFKPGIFNSGLILGYFFFLWANDSGAYVFGSLFGRRKLAPHISPNKTWEGSAGGAFMVSVVVYLNYYFFSDLALINWMIIGVIVVIAGTMGDLFKSVLKRSRNVKDCGKLLPGHGGVLDRFDSLIGSMPLVYAYLAIIG